MSFFERLRRLLRGEGTEGDAGTQGGGSGAARAISCLEALEKVHEYLDGELETSSQEEVAHHFAVCQECYPHLRLEERFREALQRAQGEEGCPERLRSQVLEMLAREAGEP